MFTLFFLLFDLAVQRTAYIYEGLTLLTATMLLLKIYYYLKEINIKHIIMNNEEIIVFFMILILYASVDILGFFISYEYQLLWEKYRVVITTLIVCLAIFISCDEGADIAEFKAVFVLSSLLISAITVTNYVLLPTFSVEYLLRLTLRRDYNVYAVVLFTGAVYGVFLPIRYSEINMEKICLSLISVASVIPTMLLSGSRRVYLSLLPTAFIWICSVMFLMKKKKVKERGLVMISAFGVTMTYLFIQIVTSGMEGYMLYLYYSPDSEYVTALNNSAETTLQDRYDSIYTSNAMEKRNVIWGIALDEYLGYSTTEKIFGRGSGRDIVIYNQSHSELVRVYGEEENYIGKLSAHNFLLADLINGGIVKVLIATLCLLSLANMMIKYLFKKPISALPYGIITGVIMISMLISSRYGILYDKILLINTTLFLIDYRRNMFYGNYLHDYNGA